MDTIVKIEAVTRPVKKGERYLVPCLVREELDFEPATANEHFVFSRFYFNQTTHDIAKPKKQKIFITPIINHLHNDIENGQTEGHYHVDYRFVKHRHDGNFPSVINNHRTHVYVDDRRPREGYNGKIEYIVLPVINEEFSGITPVRLISNSKLKHKCIHKGKCPHRGYDLSQVPEKDGVITCPLHGLKFDAVTKILIEQ